MFAKLHVCPQFTLLPIWFSTSHGEISAWLKGKVSKEGLRKQSITVLGNFLNYYTEKKKSCEFSAPFLASGELVKPHTSKLHSQ